MLRVNKITKLIEELTQTVNNTVNDTGKSIRETIGSLEKFIKGIFTTEVIGKSVLEIFKSIKKTRGEQYGKRK